MDIDVQNKRLLEDMLDSHERWVLVGPQFDYKKFYAEEFLNKCTGTIVFLKYFNFKNRNLRGADFSDQYVEDVDFTGSKLNHATFKNANAVGADFTDTDCTFTDFNECNLRYAKFDSRTRLYWANLYRANGPFVTGYFGKHYAIAYADIAVIGCKSYIFEDWLKYGKEIGRENDYSEIEIEAYMNWIQSAKKILKEMNHE